MNHLFCSFILLFSMTTSGWTQYISGVSQPDKSIAPLTDKKDVAYRLASGISAATLREHMQILASDSLEGRETGQKGLDLAADYIRKNIRAMGLYSKNGYENYYQKVAFTFSRWMDNDMYVNGKRFRLLWDYITMPEENENHEIMTSSDVVFLGYGIDDPKYNDYKDMDLKGKIILINKGEPIDKKGKSFITGTSELSDWSTDMVQKLRKAKEKGVKMVLIIEEDIKKKVEEKRKFLMSPNLQLGNVKDSILPTANHAFVSSDVAREIIGANEKKILKARKKMEKGKPSPVILATDFIMNMAKDVKILEGQNVIGYVEGKSKKDEVIIVSAHYDHLGKRGDEVFNGADDNASGSSTLLEIAQACQQAVMESNRPERSIAFIWFCGEEKGLLGSQFYTRYPEFPLSQTVANVNIDMVGRIDDKYKDNPDYIYVIGSDRLSKELHKINEEVNQKYAQLTLDYTYNDEKDPNKYYYRSDHYNFASKGIPSIFYFNGTHDDYHRTTDDADKIQFDKMANVGKLIFHTVWELANRPDRITVDAKEAK
jgi:hypothetical protein